MEAEQSVSSVRGVFIARLILGLLQGLALYLLYSTFDAKAWPATAPQIFAPLALVALFVSLMVSQGLGNLRAPTLIVWTAVAVAVVAGISWYDIWHGWFAPGHIAALPSPRAVAACAVFLFVGHALVSCGDTDRRVVARYCTLFDLAWRLGVQVAITLAFVAAFWIILALGMALFDMIKLEGFRRFVQHPWFAIPVTAVAAGVAIHITDTRAELVRGVRTLALTLLGWLLPIIALIAFAFLVSLAFTGLQPLWDTRYATTLLLAAAVVLVIHVNAAYQDGDPDNRPSHIVRVAGTLACIILIFLVWIAAYALWLRVAQYGWTVQRIYSAAAVTVAGVFALGYIVAAVLPGYWLKLIERWNVYGTFVFLAVLFALFTPIADPMRIAVASQVARLNSGAVKPDKFDFAYLRWNGGRFGQKALTKLSKSKDADVREVALAALKQTNRYAFVNSKKTRPEEIAKGITVYPKGKALPASFARQDWRNIDAASFPCLFGTDRCDAILADLDGDGVDEILLLASPGPNSWEQIGQFKRDGKSWRLVGTRYGFLCPGDRDALLAGHFKAVVPEERDIMIGTKRLVAAPPNDAGILCK
jgi:Domain of unknown function (DUF4153)